MKSKMFSSQKPRPLNPSQWDLGSSNGRVIYQMGMMIGIILFLNMTASAMVIHNYCKEKEGIRTESGKFNEDYLFLGHELSFSGQAKNLVFLGKGLTCSGATRLGLIALCEKLIFSGTSGNGIIAAGMDVVIDGAITGTSYFGCKSFTVSDRAVVDGNIFVACAKMSIDGKLHGDLYIAGGEIIINNEIQGNVIAHGGRITMGNNGKITGPLTYSAKEKLSDTDAMKVMGGVKINEKAKGDKDWDSFVKFIKSIKFFFKFGMFVSCVAVGCLLLFLPAFRKLDSKQSEKTFWNTSLWGLIPLLMYPAVIVLSIVLIVTIPLAIALILAFFPLLYSTYTVGSTLIGKYLVTKFKWNVEKRHYQFLIGALAGAIISMVPFINFLAMIFTISLGWGIYLSFLFNKDLTVAK